MRLKHALATCTTVVLAALLVPAAASPAAAAPPTTYASVRATDWSYAGSVSIGWRIRPYSLDPVTISIQDTATDGYAIGARLVTNGDNGHIVWRMRTIPSGQDTATWTTYATPGGYINNAYIEVCKIKVSTGVIASCESSSVMSAPFDDSSV
ncbi:hypothetical protein A8W25_23380 [Streptomyces sp. ERV7]|uniref:hypothetical protein n=1 Tax=Streptomyces sp. ERV7 TaxID=1322334 RepID=UPI0007F3F881|nr:hypothetical protein [Streptomyces sp. ERV7]OAR22563.1 hypothetical protein A8W25_23380 [Streptomyces sp. ERV7]